MEAITPESLWQHYEKLLRESPAELFYVGSAPAETIADLLLVDDEETLFLNDELLKGLDDELNAFLKDLLEK